jgi:hypothetical protein
LVADQKPTMNGVTFAVKEKSFAVISIMFSLFQTNSEKFRIMFGNKMQQN